MKILHTSDWQIGMPAEFLRDQRSRDEYRQHRIDAAEKALQLASERGCDAVLVAGDLFDDTDPPARDCERCLKVIKACPLPVVVLPGNHDFYGYGTVYSVLESKGHRPYNLKVITDIEPIEVTPNLEVVGLPWKSKHPEPMSVLGLLESLGKPPPSKVRVLMAHGQIRQFGPEAASNLLNYEELREAVRSGLVHYVALGDRHSTEILEGNRIAYSGTPEPTSHEETDAGNVLVVELDPYGLPPRIEKVSVGRWRFLTKQVVLGDEKDLEELERELASLGHNTYLKLTLSGFLPLHALLRLDSPDGVLERARNALGALEVDRNSLALAPEESSAADLNLTGATARAYEELRERAESDPTAKRALTMFLKLLAEERRLA